MIVRNSLEDAALNAGKNLADTEVDALNAFKLSDSESDKSARIELGKKLGIKDASLCTAQGLQLIAQKALDKARSAFEMLVNLLFARKKTLDQIIANIGR